MQVQVHFRLALLVAASVYTSARIIEIRNDVSRLDTAGNVIDCHSGMSELLRGLTAAPCSARS